MKLKQNSYLFWSIFKKFFPAPPLLPSSTSIATCGETTAPMSPSCDPRGAEARLSPARGAGEREGGGPRPGAPGAAGELPARPPAASAGEQSWRAASGASRTLPATEEDLPAGSPCRRPCSSVHPRRARTPASARSERRRPGRVASAENFGWGCSRSSPSDSRSHPRLGLLGLPNWDHPSIPSKALLPLERNSRKLESPTLPANCPHPVSPQPRTPLPRAFQDRPPRREFG